MKIDTKLFLLRLRMSLNAKSNVELAKILDVPYSTLNTWLTRNSLPVETIIGKSVCDKISIDWLLGKEDGETFDFSKLPSLDAAIDLASAIEDGMLKLNTALDSFIIEEIIEKLLHEYAERQKEIPKNIITKIKRLLFNVTNGRFLMLLNEMLGILASVEGASPQERIKEIVNGDLLHPIISKPIYKKSEKAAFQAWAESLSVEEAKFLVDKTEQIRSSLETLIPRISKANTSFDVKMIKRLTS